MNSLLESYIERKNRGDGEIEVSQSLHDIGILHVDSIYKYAYSFRLCVFG